MRNLIYLFIFNSLCGKASRLERALYIESKFLRKFLKQRSVRLLSSNFSIEKLILMEINGFDERYEGPGVGEDSDIEFRLKLINVKFKSVRQMAVLYHLYHPKTMESLKNRILFETKKLESRFRTNHGITKYSALNDIST